MEYVLICSIICLLVALMALLVLRIISPRLVEVDYRTVELVGVSQAFVDAFGRKKLPPIIVAGQPAPQFAARPPTSPRVWGLGAGAGCLAILVIGLVLYAAAFVSLYARRARPRQDSAKAREAWIADKQRPQGVKAGPNAARKRQD